MNAPNVQAGEEFIDGLTGLAYDWVFDDSALDRLARCLDLVNPGGVILLFHADNSCNKAAISYSYNFDYHLVNSYNSNLYAIDPFIDFIDAMPSDRVFENLEYIEKSVFVETKFFKEFLESTGQFRFFAVVLRHSLSTCALSVGLSSDSDDRAHLQLKQVLAALRPHLQIASRLRVQRARKELQQTRRIIHCFSTPTILTDTEGNIVDFNESAGVFLSGNRIDPLLDTHFSKKMSDSVKFSIANGKILSAFRYEVCSNGGVVFHVVVFRSKNACATNSIERKFSGVPDVAAMVIVRGTPYDNARNFKEVLNDYCISSAESEVLLRILAGDTIAEAADKLRRSKNTVRNQLVSVMAKTETRRQIDLVRLFSSVP